MLTLHSMAATTKKTTKPKPKKRKPGRPPIPGKTTISVRISEETLERVKAAAEQYGNLSVWMEDAALRKLRSLDLGRTDKSE
jgi:hypothetical protein